MGVPGLTVELTDSSGDVLAVTKTNRFGQYVFTQFSGPAADVENASGVGSVGDYNVVLVLPSFLTQTSANPSTIAISRGGQSVTGVDFTVALTRKGDAASAAGDASDSGGAATGQRTDWAALDARFAQMGTPQGWQRF